MKRELEMTPAEARTKMLEQMKKQLDEVYTAFSEAILPLDESWLKGFSLLARFTAEQMCYATLVQGRGPDLVREIGDAITKDALNLLPNNPVGSKIE